MTRRLPLVALVPLLAACAALPTKGGGVSARPTVEALLRAPDAPRFLVCGHRGAYFGDSITGGGNTRHAFEAAWRAGADLVEMDVERTADGVPVVAHDAWPRERSRDAWDAQGRPPWPLVDALAWADGKIVCLLDLKTDQVEAAVEAVRRAGAEGRVVVLADSDEELARVRAAAPALACMARPRDREAALAFTRSADRHLLLIHVDEEWADAALVEAVHASGRRVFANSWRDRALGELLGADLTAGALFDRGIDVVQTNDPAGAARARDARLRASASR